MNWIEVIDIDDMRVIIQVEKISSISETHDGGSEIRCMNDYLIVKSPLDQIIETLKQIK